MITTRYKNWWFLALNGLIAILFGFLLVFFPIDAIKTIVKFFGIFLLVIGGVQLTAGILNIKNDKSAGLILSESILFIAMGIALLVFPEITLTVFSILFGIWALIVGIVQLVIIVNAGIQLSNKNLLLFNSLLTILLGIIMFFKPLEWGAFLVIMIGIFSILFGVLLIYFSFILKSVNKKEDEEKNTKSASEGAQNPL